MTVLRFIVLTVLFLAGGILLAQTVPSVDLQPGQSVTVLAAPPSTQPATIAKGMAVYVDLPGFWVNSGTPAIYPSYAAMPGGQTPPNSSRQARWDDTSGNLWQVNLILVGAPPTTQPVPPVVTPPIVPPAVVTPPSSAGVEINVTNNPGAILYPGVGVQANIDDNLPLNGLTLAQLQQAAADNGIVWNSGDLGSPENITHGWSWGHDYAKPGTYEVSVTVPKFGASASQTIVIVPDNRTVVPVTGTVLSPKSNTIYDFGGATVSYSTTAAVDLSNTQNVCIRNGHFHCTTPGSSGAAIAVNANTVSPTISYCTFDSTVTITTSGGGNAVFTAQGSGGSSWIGDSIQQMGEGWLNELDYSGCYLRGCTSPMVNGINNYFVWNWAAT